MNNKALALEILQNKTGLVFEGGGILGICHGGALIRLYELGGLKHIEYLVGTSVGSIISTGLALGASSYYIKSKLFSMDTSRVEDGGNIFSKICRFFFKFGVNKGDYIETFIEEIINDLTGNKNITFQEAYDLTGIHLTIPYLSVKEKRTKYADYINTPILHIKTAVRWSSTMPFVFKPNRIYNKGKLSDLILDGGILDNYPLHVLKDQECNSRNIIGFKLCDKTEMDQYKQYSDDNNGDEGNENLSTNLVDFTVDLFEILYQKLMGSHVHKDEWKLTCKIDIGKYKSTDFNLTDEDKMWLYNSGRDAVDKHLEEIEEMLNNNDYPNN